MGLILRVDVDKPYGNHTLVRKIFSKFVEDYFPNLPPQVGYLSHLKEFLNYCNKMGVQGTFFHRLCTIPDQESLNLINIGGHKIGLHLENSSSKESCLMEYKAFKKKIGEVEVIGFSKHGSGIYKLGKHHYPKYEPILYKSWEKELSLKFLSGNEIPQCKEDLKDNMGYFPKVFWIERIYRSNTFNSLEELIQAAKQYDVVVLIHPCNYLSDKETKNDFQELVKISIEENISWKHFNECIT